MAAAERALRLATAHLAAEVVERFSSAAHLSPDDRSAALALATEALRPFQPAPAAKQNAAAPGAAAPGAPAPGTPAPGAPAAA